MYPFAMTRKLLCDLKHASVAHASMHAVTKRRAGRLPIRKKLLAKKKLDKQLSFCSTNAGCLDVPHCVDSE